MDDKNNKKYERGSETNEIYIRDLLNKDSIKLGLKESEFTSCKGEIEPEVYGIQLKSIVSLNAAGMEQNVNL